MKIAARWCRKKLNIKSLQLQLSLVISLPVDEKEEINNFKDFLNLQTRNKN